jgi:hypothetical protein
MVSIALLRVARQEKSQEMQVPSLYDTKASCLSPQNASDAPRLGAPPADAPDQSAPADRPSEKARSEPADIAPIRVPSACCIGAVSEDPDGSWRLARGAERPLLMTATDNPPPEPPPL